MQRKCVRVWAAEIRAGAADLGATYILGLVFIVMFISTLMGHYKAQMVGEDAYTNTQKHRRWREDSSGFWRLSLNERPTAHLSYGSIGSPPHGCLRSIKSQEGREIVLKGTCENKGNEPKWLKCCLNTSCVRLL